LSAFRSRVGLILAARSINVLVSTIIGQYAPP
jgi:hypothetical protein